MLAAYACTTDVEVMTANAANKTRSPQIFIKIRLNDLHKKIIHNKYIYIIK